MLRAPLRIPVRGIRGSDFLLVAVTDLLIAALAHEITGLVWSLDSDFKNMAGLGMVQLYESDEGLPKGGHYGRPKRRVVSGLARPS